MKYIFLILGALITCIGIYEVYSGNESGIFWLIYGNTFGIWAEILNKKTGLGETIGAKK